MTPLDLHVPVEDIEARLLSDSIALQAIGGCGVECLRREVYGTNESAGIDHSSTEFLLDEQKRSDDERHCATFMQETY
jgi:hypothetical protein